jgi:hypothetical protein
MSDLQAMARLMTLLRLNLPQGQAGLMCVEVLLHVAAGPRTMAELEVLTGASNGPLSRAVRTFIPWVRRSDGAVIVPVMPLLKRIKRPGQKAPVIFLSLTGWKELNRLGLMKRGG